MNKLPLLPHRFQKIGYILLVPCVILGIAYIGWDWEIPFLSYSGKHLVFNLSNENFTDELAAAGTILSLMLIVFSKEKVEDEAIQFFRLASLQWAVIVNYLVLLVCLFVFYGGDFLSVMIYNMFTVLILFVIRFRIVLWKHNKNLA
jgi:membrane protein CcdC involved in cytochrome C biogenesis